ncbi:MAG TPA: ATP-binding protein, partial [Acidimicrobiales bacterium]|nr:ATP-binding protein [Acidimicrobiales bacterium]
AAGKSPEGTIRLSAALDGGRVRLTIADDGAGLDVASLRAAAGYQGLGIEDQELPFVAGVSTASAVTDVSGRGIGLDAVRARVESLGGAVRLNTKPGQGTEVVVHVPTSLAVLRVILVRAGSELIALPVAALQRLRAATAGQIQSADGQLTFVTDEGTRPAVYLGAVLGFSERDLVGRPVKVVELAGEDAVLLVDSVESDRDALLQPLPPRLGGSRILLGAILLPQDRVGLVVNPSTCVREGRVA